MRKEGRKGLFCTVYAADHGREGKGMVTGQRVLATILHSQKVESGQEKDLEGLPPVTEFLQ